MKKLITIITIMALTVSLAGCRNFTATQTEGGRGTSAAEAGNAAKYPRSGSDVKSAQRIGSGAAASADNSGADVSGESSEKTESSGEMSVAAESSENVENESSSEHSETTGGESSENSAEASSREESSSSGQSYEEASTQESSGHAGQESTYSAEHEHDWQPVYKTIHHEAEYETVHHEAEWFWVSDDKYVDYMTCMCGLPLAVYIEGQVIYTYEGAADPFEEHLMDQARLAHESAYYIMKTFDNSTTGTHGTYAVCSACGLQIAKESSSGERWFEGDTGSYEAAFEYHRTHLDTPLGSPCGAWHNGKPEWGLPDYVLAAIAEAQPGTFHLDEEKSHDEYDEKVLVKEAWDEQVIDYYECDCGARKY